MSVLIGSGANYAGLQYQGSPGTGRVWSVEFFQQNDGINFGSGATLDDLLLGDCTIECWVKMPNGVGVVYMLAKRNAGGFTNGWYFAANSTIFASASFAGNVFYITSTTAIDDSDWHHVVIDWDVGTLTGRLFVDGALENTDAAVGAYQSDAAYNLICNGSNAIGSSDNKMTIGPIRISSYRRYTGASFTPPRIWEWPEADGYDRLITSMGDGSGATVTDYSGNSNNGTITFGATTRWILSEVA